MGWPPALGLKIWHDSEWTRFVVGDSDAPGRIRSRRTFVGRYGCPTGRGLTQLVEHLRVDSSPQSERLSPAVRSRWLVSLLVFFALPSACGGTEENPGTSRPAGSDGGD